MVTLPTKKRMREIAQQARRHGYYRHSEWSIGVTCPQCRAEVHASLGYGSPSVPKALDAAMLAHLPACTVVLAARDGEDISRVGHVTLSEALDLAPMNSDASRVIRTAYDAAVSL